MKTSIVVSALLSACIAAKPVKPTPAIAAVQSKERFKFSAHAHQTRLAAVVIDVPVGYVFGDTMWGFNGTCTERRANINTDGRMEFDRKRYLDVFNAAMKAHGYPVDTEEEIFRNTEEKVADLQVAARITELTLNMCNPRLSDTNKKTQGSAYMKVEWSGYSTLEKRVLFAFTTEGSTGGQIESAIGELGFLRAALADAAEHLAVSKEYRAEIDPPAAPAAATASAARIRVHRASVFAGDLQAHLDAIKQAVATVRANRGSGSGFIISDDGVVITAEHVVSGSKFAKINTAAGKECYGEVVAASKQRDLAVIKVDCGPLPALPIAREQVSQGGDVFAVGTPLSDKLQFSVTKGVVSGMRKLETLDFIQSDVTVLPGSSGGPLLDVHGNAVGVTSEGISHEGTPLHVNLFIPMADLPKYLPVDLD